MRLYPYWLDAEYMNPTNRMGVDPGAWSETGNRLLRLLALFGIRIVISHPQLLSSAPILDLFSNKNEFQSLLSEDPNFIELNAKSEEGVPEERTKASIGLAAFRRVIQPPYTNTIYPDSKALHRVAEVVCKMASIDIEALSSVNSNPLTVALRGTDPRTERMLRAALNAASYFAYDPKAKVSQPVGEPISYYSILRRVVEQPREQLRENDERALNLTLDFLKPEIESQEGLSVRSAPIGRLIAGPRTPETEAIYGTIVGAWNASVEESIGSDQGAEPRLPQAAILGPYLKRVTGVVLPEGSTAIRAAVAHDHRLAKFLAVDYSGLTWVQIAELIKATGPSRQRFQSALLHYRHHFPPSGPYVGDLEADAASNTLAEAFDAHARALAEKAVQFEAPRMENWLFVVGVPIGVVAAHLGLNWILSLAAGFAPGIAQLKAKSVLRRGREAAFIHTLSDDLRKLGLAD